MFTDPGGSQPGCVILVEGMVRNTDQAVIAAAFAAVRHDFSGAWMQACQALDEPRLTVYLRGLPAAATLGQVADLVRGGLRPLAEGEVEVSRLTAIQSVPGASPEGIPDYHYVVRTDVLPGSEQELERWYDEEHMPALAAVPGVVRAERLISLDAPPRFYACYELISPAVRSHPAWIAARETAWSSRVRPLFRHTRRIVSRRVSVAQIQASS